MSATHRRHADHVADGVDYEARFHVVAKHVPGIDDHVENVHRKPTNNATTQYSSGPSANSVNHSLSQTKTAFTDVKSNI